MPKRRNEQECLVRQEPFEYVAAYNANNAPTNEAWAEAGAILTDAKWICCEHTYDASGNLVRTKWAKDSNNVVGDFTNIIGVNNTTASLLTGLTYV